MVLSEKELGDLRGLSGKDVAQGLSLSSKIRTNVNGSKAPVVFLLQPLSSSDDRI